MEEMWEVYYNGEEDGELYAISIVDRPANKMEFIALTEQRDAIQLKADKKRQILYGVVLRPDQEIYREDENGDPFYIKFSSDTIVKLSQDFMRRGFQNNSTFNHDEKVQLSDTTVVESWLVENADNDKAKHLGLNVQDGDWVIGMKLGDESWKNFIETGKAVGFSIDSFLRLRRIDNAEHSHSSVKLTRKVNIKKNKNKMSVMKRFLKMFLAEATVDGNTLTAEAFVEGNTVYDENGDVFVGEFEVDGNKIVTDTEGVIVSVTAIDEVELEDETDTVEEVVEEVVEEAAEEITEVIEELKKEIEDLIEEEKEAEVAMRAMKVEMKKLKNEIAELKKQPRISKVKANPLNMSNQKGLTSMEIIANLVKNNRK